MSVRVSAPQDGVWGAIVFPGVSPEVGVAVVSWWLSPCPPC